MTIYDDVAFIDAATDVLMHHGVLGQKWGTRNGPPYPLKPSAHSASEKKAGWRKSLSSSAKSLAGGSSSGNAKLKKALMIGGAAVATAAVGYAAYKICHDPEVVDVVKLIASERRGRRKPLDMDAIEKAMNSENEALARVREAAKDTAQSQALRHQFMGEALGREMTPLEAKRLEAVNTLWKRDNAVQRGFEQIQESAHADLNRLRYAKQGGAVPGATREGGKRAKDLVTSRLSPVKKYREAAQQRMAEADQAKITQEMNARAARRAMEDAASTDREGLLAVIHQYTGQIQMEQGLSDVMKRAASAA